jgi:hypothetical protein
MPLIARSRTRRAQEIKNQAIVTEPTIPALFLTGDRLTTTGGQLMTNRRSWLALVPALLFTAVAVAQHPILDKVADKVVQKYQQSTCEQLWQEKAQKQGRPKPEMEQNAVQMLHNDPQMRTEFINRVAAPVANKMFECGMIP